MNDQTLKELKEEYLKHIQNFVNDNGSLFAHVTVFADKIPSDDNSDISESIIHIPVPGEYLQSDEAKDYFVDYLLPQILRKIKKEFVPAAIGWAAEATLRQADANFDITKENWRKIPVTKDVIMISIETKNNTSTYLYEIKKLEDDEISQIAVNKYGEISKRIELIDITSDHHDSMKQIGGRFSNLYNKLIG
jgi:hypothetical protein